MTIRSSDGVKHRLAIDWPEFKRWIESKYAKTYSNVIWNYTRKYHHLIAGNLRDLDLLGTSVKNNVIKSLIVLSKFLGINKGFKARLEDYGVKTTKPSVMDAFLRILKASESDIIDWYKDATTKVRSNEQLYLKLCLMTGLRKQEGIDAFNLIIKSAKENRLSQYYNDKLSALEHFKHKHLFFRHTKNAYISFVSKKLVDQIANSKPLTYYAIRKRLERKGLRVRINELRDFYGSYVIKHGLIREEQDLLCGRISSTVFLQFYWSPSFRDLRDQTLKAIEQLEQSL